MPGPGDEIAGDEGVASRLTIATEEVESPPAKTSEKIPSVKKKRPIMQPDSDEDEMLREGTEVLNVGLWVEVGVGGE